MPERFQDECGVFGVWGAKNAASVVQRGLKALQHRGPEGAGIAVAHMGRLRNTTGLGAVKSAIEPPWIEAHSKATSALGHVRYSTSSERTKRGLQPFVLPINNRALALAHNGNLTSDTASALAEHDLLPNSASDSEAILQMICAIAARSSHPSLRAAINDAMNQLQGAYALGLLDSSGELFALKDPLGLRPLCVGVLPDACWAHPSHPAIVFASESVALDKVGAALLGEVPRGRLISARQIAEASKAQLTELFSSDTAPPERFCIFETIYFASPNTHFIPSDAPLHSNSREHFRSRPSADTSCHRPCLTVRDHRRLLGRALAEEAPVPAHSLVVPVPRTGVDAAQGFGEFAELQVVAALTASTRARAFLAPAPQRSEVNEKKHTVDPAVVRGQHIALVDDSLVRGNTLYRLVAQLKRAGAASIHVRIASAPVHFPCFFGIDTPTQEELLAPQYGQPTDDIGQHVANTLGATSVAYLSLQAMRSMVTGRGLCDACFSGDFPIPVDRLLRS